MYNLAIHTIETIFGHVVHVAKLIPSVVHIAVYHCQTEGIQYPSSLANPSSFHYKYRQQQCPKAVIELTHIKYFQKNVYN